MKCYYEELNVERDANESEIKTAYRKLALKWHPDKNPGCIDEAKERFQLIQQAYEVLSDPQERAWYDNHREQILRGKNSEYEDNRLDVFQYFTVSCFKGYADDDKGFYAVYREVFEKIATEDAEFMDDEEELASIPKFGDSNSNYEEVVGPFYAYWSAYCTKRTYTWLCPYDIKEIKDRRILREIEKDMKKVVQEAKKERNAEVRNLVSFIRKRDKRVLAYKKLLEERAAFNRQKQEQNRLEQIRRRQQELQEMRQNSQAVNSNNDDYEEQLKQLEQQYSSDEEYYEEDEDASDGQVDDSDNEKDLEEEQHYIDDLYCIACNKEFKTAKAFENHEMSKKHNDNLERLKKEMKAEEDLFQQEENTQEAKSEDVISNDDEDENTTARNDPPVVGIKNKSNKSKSKKQAKKLKNPVIVNSNEHINGADSEEELPNKLDKATIDEDDDDDWGAANKKSSKKSKNKTKSKTNKPNLSEPSNANETTKSSSKSVTKPMADVESETIQHVCVTCKSKFESKNKLFSHLKLTNHGVFIPKTKSNDDNSKSRKAKGKRN